MDWRCWHWLALGCMPMLSLWKNTFKTNLGDFLSKICQEKTCGSWKHGVLRQQSLPGSCQWQSRQLPRPKGAPCRMALWQSDLHMWRCSVCYGFKHLRPLALVRSKTSSQRLSRAHWTTATSWSRRIDGWWKWRLLGDNLRKKQSCFCKKFDIRLRCPFTSLRCVADGGRNSMKEVDMDVLVTDVRWLILKLLHIWNYR